MEKEIKNKKFELSEEQKKAAYNHGNTIVSAGAGCGKTTTMVERIFGKIKEGVPLDEMLIVTFTRASAADIRNKLSTRFSEILTPSNSPDNERTEAANSHDRELILEAQYAMPSANIGTLHSFCQKLIRSYFYAANIDPGRTISEELDSDLMKKICVRAAIRDAKLGDEYFATLCEMLSDRRTDEGMEKAVSKIVDYALSLPDDDNFFERTRADADSYAAVDALVAEKRAAINDRIKDFYVESASVGLTKLLPAIDGLADYVAGRGKKPDLPSIKKEPFGEEKAEKFCALRDKCVKIVEFAERVQAAKSVDSEPYVKALLAVARDALSRYAEKKEERGVIDYSDLEHGASKILSDEKCLAEITAGIKYVFIDEYQDVNPLQNSIAEKFADAGSEIFLVGDVKQSIYGFRRCEPRYFNAALCDSRYKRFDLTENRRSDSAIIDFVNNVFSAAMTESVGGVNYADGRNELKAKSPFVGSAEFVVIASDAQVIRADKSENEIDADEESKNGPCPQTYEESDFGAAQAAEELAPTEEKNGKQAKESETPYSVINALPKPVDDPEAYYIANRILELADPEKGKANFGDIAILLRATNNDYCARLTDTLRSLGIPVSVGRRAKLENFPEAFALVDIARCVDTSMDDLALYTALSSPMGGFSDGELAEIAAIGAKNLAAATKKADVKTPLWRKVAAYDGTYKKRLDDFFSLREKFRVYASCHDAADTLGYITSETDYFTYVYGVKGGRSASAVEALISDAAEYKCDLHEFIEICSDPEYRLDTTAVGDAVRIETIHASKGIEYDYCFVAGCGRKFKFDDAYASVIVDSDGVALKVPKDGETVDSAPYIVAQNKCMSTTRSEEMRMLYVALTRAKKMLIVTGKEKKQNSDGPTCYLDYMGGVKPEYVTQVVAPTVKDFGDKTDAKKDVNADADEEANRKAIADEIRKRCSFVYPREVDSFGAPCEIIPSVEDEKSKIRRRPIPIKTSVTAVAESDDEYEAKPFVLEDDGERGGENVRRKRFSVKTKTEDKYAGLTAGEIARLRGTAYHRAMELIDFSAPDFSAIESKIDDVELVDEKKVIKAAAEMKKLAEGAALVLKERYFIADIPVDGRFDGESVLVQGVIDLLIVDGNGNATIVDYKTTAESGLHSKGYATQLDLYAEAVEKSTSFKVVEKMLYSFDKGFIDLDK